MTPEKRKYQAAAAWLAMREQDRLVRGITLHDFVCEAMSKLQSRTGVFPFDKFLVPQTNCLRWTDDDQAAFDRAYAAWLRTEGL